MTEYHIVNRIRDQIKNRSGEIAVKSRKNDEWISYTWSDFGREIESTAKALLGLKVQVQDKIAIYSNNSVEWSVADFASLYCRCVTVPIYSTNTAEQTAYVLQNADVKVIFVGNKSQLNSVLEIVDQCPMLEKIIVLDDIELPDHQLVTSFKNFKRTTDNFLAVDLELRLESLCMCDLFTLIYTSGTTGTPKGVMLDFNNITSQLVTHDGIFDLKAGDSSLCFLPLSHVFERAWTYYVLHRGVVNCYLDDTSRLREAFAEIKPNYLSAVPRVYEKLYSAIQDKVSKASLFKKLLFTWSIDTGYRVALAKQNGSSVSRYLKIKHSVAEKLVLRNLRKLLGGNIKIAPCGGAKLDANIGRFFHAIGLDLKLGYGMTETTATISIWRTGSFNSDSVGLPVDGADVKIGDNNEILVKGPMVMRGYYKMETETAQTFTDDGYLKTGDAGHLDENGNLFITDRIKDLMKTSCGKYIAPQVVEGVIGKDRFIEQIAVVADARKYVSALVVPCYEAIEEYAAELNIKYKDRMELLKNSEIVAVIEKRIAEVQKDLARFEQVKKFTLLPKEFTMKSGELTPTQKLKRKVIQDRYHKEIDDMYEEKKENK